MKKKLMAVVLSALMAFGLAGCGSTGKAGSSAENPLTMKYSVTFSSSGTQAEGANRLGEIIEEKSDKRLRFQFYPSAQLGDKVASMEGLRAGTIEMMELAATDLSTFNDMWSVLSLPYLWDNDKQAVEVVTSGKAREYIDKEMESYGFKVIAWTSMGARSVLNDKHTVSTPEDLKGLKLRVMEEAILAEATTKMGAIATPMASSEIYTALQQGTIDGLDHTPSVIASSGYTELAKYFSLTEHFIIPDPVFVSLKWFNNLSEENQKAVVEAGEAFTEEWNNEIWPKATEEGLQTMKDAGVEITEVDKDLFRAKVQPMVDDFVKNGSEKQAEFYNLLMEGKAEHPVE